MTEWQSVAQVAQSPWGMIGGSVILSGAVVGIGKRIVGAFDTLGNRVEGFQTILASHEREDVTRFAAIEDRASTRHEALIAEVRKHADITTSVTSPMQSEIEKHRLRIEALEGHPLQGVPERRHRGPRITG